MENEQPFLTIVVPCYNEQEVLDETIKQLTSIMNQLIKEDLVQSRSKILFVDDGSSDLTWQILSKASANNRFVRGLKLARNVGHQTALLAGLEKAQQQSDCVISIDADLQDDVSVIRDFIIKYHNGYEIVYGVRKSRDTDTFFKRITAQGFYRFMHKLGINLVYNHADYRLMSSRAIKELTKYEEENLFLRGIIPLIGFKSTEIIYDRKERFAGNSKYPLRKMLSLALKGITSFSIAPIRLITYVGLLLFVFSVIAGSYAIIQKLLGNTQAGWTSLMISVWLLGGLQLICIGIIGEYIGRIFMEVKKRPKYAIDIDLFTDKDPLIQLRYEAKKKLLAKKIEWNN